MIPAELYQYVYLILVCLATFVLIQEYNRPFSNRSNISKPRIMFLLASFMAFFIGIRPPSIAFADMLNYYNSYQHIFGQSFEFTFETNNYIFDNILPWFASMKVPAELYFILIAAIYFGCMAWACVKIFPRDALLAFVVCLGAFSTFSYGTNGIKAGAAASIFLLALAYRNNKPLAIFFLWASLGFHHSMLAPIVAYVIAYFYRKPNAYLWAWIVCLLLAAAHVTYFQLYFAGFTNEHGSEYLVGDRYENAVSGFRPDFILYSAVPIFIGYYLLRIQYVASETYKFLWCIYTMTNCVFLLCTYATFVNRIAYLSWLMYPIVLLYPFVNTQWAQHPNMSKRYLKYAVYGHLGFTAFMTFIYYA